MKRLLLFDVDGTLLRANGTGRIMLAESMRRVYGTAGAIDTYEFGGRTDRRMVRDLLTREGWTIEAIEERLPELYAEMIRQGEQLFNTGQVSACPGVPELLARLHGRPDAVLGLLTGNIEPTARLKIRAARLDPDQFRVGAFGSDSVERNDLLPIVWRRANELTGHAFAGIDTVIIGDTPADIQCAQSGAVRSVAVSTGWSSKDSLRQCEPDHLLDDLADIDRVVDVLLG